MNEAIDIANYFVTKAQQIDENDLTNLKLQKMLYYAQGESIISNGDLLFSDQIDAWQYGPVVKTVYGAFKSCGSFPVTVFDVAKTIKPNKVTKCQDFLDQIWEKYNKYSAFFLVEHTHKEGSCWDIAYNKEPDVYQKIITTELLSDKFEPVAAVC